MRQRLDSDAIKRLATAGNYREFIHTWIEERSRVGRFGFASIARVGGFKSRAFPRDVVLGKKRLTPRSLGKFTKGLGLPVDLAEVFRILVALEEPDCRAPREDVGRIERSLSFHRRRLLSRTGIHIKQESQAKIFEDDLMRIYASLGTEKDGASLQDVILRSRLPEISARMGIDRLLKLGIATWQKDRIYPNESFIVLESLQKSMPFQRRYERSCHRAAKAAESHFDSPNKLFLTSAISIREVDLPRLKQELRKILTQFLETAETAEGDRVVELLTAFF